jgi:ribA/ribD-fused uncharacterized protein
MIRHFDGEHAFLSSFFPLPMVALGYFGMTAEHIFQATKTLDPEARQMILTAATPGRAKRAGRSCALRSDWEDVKVGIMREVVRCKFAVGTAVAEALLATGLVPIVEGNTWHDQVWGDCECGRAACANDGANLLGALLEQRRAEIRDLLALRDGRQGRLL